MKDRDKTLEWVALVVLIVGAVVFAYAFTWWVALPILVIGGAIIGSRLWQRHEPPGPAE